MNDVVLKTLLLPCSAVALEHALGVYVEFGYMITDLVERPPIYYKNSPIKDLIVRLMAEANEEAEHKGWCDTELSTNEQTRKEKTEAVETLHAEIDQLEASIAKLTEDISELTKAVAELDAAMAKVGC